MLNCWCITWPVGFKRLTEGFGPKAVENSRVNCTARNGCAKGTTISRQSIAHHRTRCQSLHWLSYIRSPRIFTFLCSLQDATYNFTLSNFVRPAISVVAKYEKCLSPGVVLCGHWATGGRPPYSDGSSWNRQLMDRSRPSDFRSMNPKYFVSQRKVILFVASFQYCLPSDMAIRTLFRVALYNTIWHLKFSWRF